MKIPFFNKKKIFIPNESAVVSDLSRWTKVEYKVICRGFCILTEKEFLHQSFTDAIFFAQAHGTEFSHDVAVMQVQEGKFS